MSEQWKAISFTNGEYEVSNTGKVRSMPRFRNARHGQRWDNGKVLKQNLTLAGYPTVSLPVEGKIKSKTIHRLVASAFLENPDNLNVVNHKDGNKKNNNLENLEWATYKQNNIHSTIINNKFGENTNAVKLNWLQVLTIKTLRSHPVYTCGVMANMYGVHKNTVSQAQRGITWKI